MKVAERRDTMSLSASSNGAAFGVEHMAGYSIQAVYEDETPDPIVVPSADIDNVESTFTIEGHGLETGSKFQIATDDTLPDPLAPTTDYYVIVIDEDTIKLATSLANAMNGTAINLVDDGVGNQTMTFTALSGEFKLQASNNAFTDNTGLQENPNAGWEDIDNSDVDITTSGQQLWNVTDVFYRAIRVVYTRQDGAGQGSATVYIFAKGVI